MLSNVHETSKQLGNPIPALAKFSICKHGFIPPCCKKNSVLIGAKAQFNDEYFNYGKIKSVEYGSEGKWTSQNLQTDAKKQQQQFFNI